MKIPEARTLETVTPEDWRKATPMERAEFIDKWAIRGVFSRICLGCHFPSGGTSMCDACRDFPDIRRQPGFYLIEATGYFDKKLYGPYEVALWDGEKWFICGLEVPIELKPEKVKRPVAGIWDAEPFKHKFEV